MDNYRPISVLPSISKVLEQAVSLHLPGHLEGITSFTSYKVASIHPSYQALSKNGYRFSLELILTGVPQVSTLGPLLLSLFIKDLLQSYRNSCSIMHPAHRPATWFKPYNHLSNIYMSHLTCTDTPLPPYFPILSVITAKKPMAKRFPSLNNAYCIILTLLH